MRSTAFTQQSVTDSKSGLVVGSLDDLDRAVQSHSDRRRQVADVKKLLNILRCEGTLMATAIKRQPRDIASSNADSVMHHLSQQNRLMADLVDRIFRRMGSDPLDPSVGWLRGSLMRQLTDVVSHWYLHTRDEDMGRLTEVANTIADLVVDGFQAAPEPAEMPVTRAQWDGAELATRTDALTKLMPVLMRYDFLFNPDVAAPKMMALLDAAVRTTADQLIAATTTPTDDYDRALIRRSATRSSAELLAAAYEHGALSFAAAVKSCPEKATRGEYLKANRITYFRYIESTFKASVQFLAGHVTTGRSDDNLAS